MKQWRYGRKIGTKGSALQELCHFVIRIKSYLYYDSVAYGNPSIMFFQSIRHDPFEKNVEEGG